MRLGFTSGKQKMIDILPSKDVMHLEKLLEKMAKK